MTGKPYGDAEIAARLARDLPHWTYVDGTIRRTFNTHGWKASMMVANAAGHLAEAAWHHPDIVISYNSVEIRLSTHSADGITDKDFDLAAKLEEFIGWQPAKENNALDGTPNNDKRFAYIKYEN